MTDASQEGALAEQLYVSLATMLKARRGELDATAKGFIATQLAECVEDYYRSKGVPIDALQHGRMVPMDDALRPPWVRLFRIVPDEPTGEVGA